MARTSQVRHLGEVHTVWKGYLECALDGTNLWKALGSGMGLLMPLKSRRFGRYLVVNKKGVGECGVDLFKVDVGWQLDTQLD